MYFCINQTSGYIEEKVVNKYLIFDSTELHSVYENKDLLKKYNNVIKNTIITIRSVFKEDGKLYP